MSEYPKYSGQCNTCIHWNNESEIGNVGCDSEDIWDEGGNELDEKALDYQDGTVKCDFYRPNKIEFAPAEVGKTYKFIEEEKKKLIKNRKEKSC